MTLDSNKPLLFNSTTPTRKKNIKKIIKIDAIQFSPEINWWKGEFELKYIQGKKFKSPSAGDIWNLWKPAESPSDAGNNISKGFLSDLFFFFSREKYRR